MFHVSKLHSLFTSDTDQINELTHIHLSTLIQSYTYNNHPLEDIFKLENQMSNLRYFSIQHFLVMINISVHVYFHEL